MPTVKLTESDWAGLLVQALGEHSSCAFLDYPDHLNVGDHLIWLSALEILHDCKIAVRYCSSLVDFSSAEMDRHAGKSPIVFQGGGNLGDLWPDSQEFREKIIAEFRDRPIIIFAQSVHFSDSANARRAASIFNAHPDLTLFIREKSSFRIASELFANCRTVLAPDMVLWSGKSKWLSSAGAYFAQELPPSAGDPAKSPLFLTRGDAELNELFRPEQLGLGQVRTENWCTYSWAYAGRGKLRSYDEWYWKLPGSVSLYRELWQRRPAGFREFLNRWKWEHCHPASGQLARLPGAAKHRFSWSIVHDAMRQIARNDLIITNRLHGQLLAYLLGKPSVLIPNVYHKNQSFFETWMRDVSNCHFAETPDQLRDLVRTLT